MREHYQNFDTLINYTFNKFQIQEYLLKHVKLNKLTIHVPGHSSLGSGGSVVSDGDGVVGLVDGGRLGGGLVLMLLDVLVLSQHTDPLLQVEVLGINTEGLSQNAAIM